MWESSWGDSGNTAIAVDTLTPPLNLEWSAETGFASDNAILRKRLLASGGRIIATKHDFDEIPAYVALNPTNGSVYWKSGTFAASSSVLSNLGIYAVSKGMLWGALPHEIGFKINIKTGEQIALGWGRAAPESAYSVGNRNGVCGYGIGGVNSIQNPQVSCLNSDTTVRWTRNYKGLFASAPSFYAGGRLSTYWLLGQPASDGNLLFVPMGRLEAIDIASGKTEWSAGQWTAQCTKGDVSFFGKAHFAGGILYALGQQYNGETWEAPRLYAFRSATGSALWDIAVPPYTNYAFGMYHIWTLPTDPISFTVSNGVVYVRSSSDLSAIKSDGSVLWTYEFSAPYIAGNSANYPLTGPLILSGNTLYAIHNTQILAFHADGSVLWSWTDPPSYKLSWMIEAYRRLLVIDSAGIVYAFS